MSADKRRRSFVRSVTGYDVPHDHRRSGTMAIGLGTLILIIILLIILL